MTLVEAIAGILIFAIIAASATTILASVSRAYVKANDLAEANVLLNSLSSVILTDLRYTSGVTVSGSEIEIKTGSGTVVYDVEDGLLYRDERPVFDRQYYKGKTIAMEYYADDGESEAEENPIKFIVRIKLFSESKALMVSRDYATRPLVLNAYQ